MGPGGVSKKATLAGGVGIAFVAIAAYALLGRGDNDGVSVSRTNTPEATATATITPGPTATYTPVPTATPSVYIPGPEGFICPTKWTPYECPIVSPDAQGLIAPFPAGTDVEIMCKYVEFMTQGVENNTYMLIKVPPNTPVMALYSGIVAGVYDIKITPNGKFIHLYSKPSQDSSQYRTILLFVGTASVSMGDNVTSGQELGISSGLPPYSSDPNLRPDFYRMGQDFDGASIIIGIQLNNEPRLRNASDPLLWAGNALSCPPSQ